MTRRLFTKESSELAARLHGDPNLVHYIDNIFGATIAPGLQQLQGFIALYGWRPGQSLNVNLENPLFVPSQADYHPHLKGIDFEYSVSDQNTTYSRATTSKSQPFQKSDSFLQSYRYMLTDKAIGIKDLEDPDAWKTYFKVSFYLLSGLIPETNVQTLQRAAAVGVSANAFVRTLYDDPEFLPDLFFPKVREGEKGKTAVLEESLVLYMGDSFDGERIKNFELEVEPVRTNPGNKRELIATVSETSGLYTLEMHLTTMKKKVLERMLKGVPTLQ